MSGMIETVARTIYARDPITDQSGELTWKQLQQRAPELARMVRHQARDAIEAMREPTEWMLTKGACYEDPADHYADDPLRDEGDLSRDVWKAMIDAALSDSGEDA